MKIEGQAALVTGGGSGLGAATAKFLAEQGARVTVFDIDADKAKAQAAAIGGMAISGDVASEADAEDALAACTQAFGAPRILVNCAGIGVAKRIVGRDGPMPLAEFERVIRINLVGSFNMLRVCAAAMTTLEPLTDGERGVIISTASAAAYEGQVGQTAYAASKGGIVSMILPAARELAQFGIRVAAIAPGLLLTPLLQNLPEETQTSLAAAIPFPRRLGHADEFAALVGHIVTNGYINGEVIRLDGALRMAPR
jgi:NAD(P)-dependent dehydrogenase (short-subunit alcohol dehydrogenase family)